MSARLARLRVRGETGFTVVEMVVAIAIGGVVVLAAFTMLDRSVVLTNQTSDRVDTTQIGRAAMDTITRHLRSQVCPVAGSSAIEAADDYSITFWAFFGTHPFAPERHTIAWDATGQRIVEQVDAGKGTPVSANRVLLQAARLPNNVPLFRYFTYPGSTPAEPTLQLATPLTAADAKRVARIEINFTAAPSRSNLPAGQASQPSGLWSPFTDAVYVRTSDPNSDAGPQGPSCG